MKVQVVYFEVITVFAHYKVHVSDVVKGVLNDYLKRDFVFYQEHFTDDPSVKPKQHLVLCVTGTPVRIR